MNAFILLTLVSLSLPQKLHLIFIYAVDSQGTIVLYFFSKQIT